MSAKIGSITAVYDASDRRWVIAGLPSIPVRKDEHPLAALLVWYPNARVDG